MDTIEKIKVASEFLKKSLDTLNTLREAQGMFSSETLIAVTNFDRLGGDIAKLEVTETERVNEGEIKSDPYYKSKSWSFGDGGSKFYNTYICL